MAEEAGSVDAGNPAPEGTPAGEAPAPEAATPEAAPAAGPNEWVSGIEDEGLRGWVESKGLNNGSVENVLKSYQNLEKVFGADKAGRTVVLPGPDADETAMGEFYTKLGRPEKPDGYELPVPDGDDGRMSEWAKGVFHEAGLSDKQATAISEKWNAYVGGMQGQASEAEAARGDEAEAALRREWGAAYDQKVAQVDNAAVKLGMNEEQLAGLRSSMGPADAMKFVANLAEQMGEASFDNDGVSENNNMMTPARAQEELAKLNMDKEFMDAWLNRTHPSHNWAVERKQNLSKMAAGYVG
jgi:hypothetical protein